MNTGKGLIFFVLFAVFFVSCNAGNNGADSVSKPGVLPILSESISQNIAVGANVNVIDYNTNEYTKWLEEQTGKSF